MADTYGVTETDIAAELPGIFPWGFSANTTPTDGQVSSFISTQDTIVTLRVTDDVAKTPSVNDKAAAIAKRFIIESVKAIVLRIVYTGNSAADVEAAVRPYVDAASSLLATIDGLGAQAVGTGEAAPRILGNMPTRELLLDDCDLDGGFTRGRF